MATLVTGECLGVTEEHVSHQGKSWVQQEIHLLDGVHTRVVRVAREFRGTLPEKGDMVVLTAFARAWKSKNGNVGLSWTALGRSAEAEAALTGLALSS